MTAETLLKLAKHYETLDEAGRKRQHNLKPLYDKYIASLPKEEVKSEPEDKPSEPEEEVVNPPKAKGRKK